MLRRLLAFVLAVACACAPVMGAFAVADHQANDCCCGTKCPCPPVQQNTPRTANAAPTTAPSASVEERAAARKPSARQARAPFSPFLALWELSPAARRSASDRVGPAAGVALFQAHCSLLI